MKKYYSFSLILSLIISIFLFACSKDATTPAPTTVKQWTIGLSAKNENPAPASRNETGTTTLQLLSDNSLKYTIAVTGLAAGDALVAAHLHSGNVITSGPVILGFDPVFSGGNASGLITNLRSTLVDSLKSDDNEIYFNAHSTQVGAGLIRGQLNTNVELASDVAMSGSNEVPAVTTTATGLALIRLTSKKQLYTKINISSLEAGDSLKVAHIHKGAAGANGPVYIGIYGNSSEFGTVKSITVDDATFASLKADPLYVNAHSSTKPGGIIRGQVR